MPAPVKVIWDDAAVHLWSHADPSCLAALDAAAAALTLAMKRRCPVSPVGALHQSGFLRSSIRAFRLPDGSIIVGPTAPYAEYVTDGTAPHIIHSKGPWSLHNAETGQYFGPEVHHPGTAPNHFVVEAVGDVGVLTLGSAA
jgi:hypothetical protein